MNTETLIFEQPVNELMRVCLRLEYLQHKAQFFLNRTSPWDSQACVSTIIDMLNLLDRPDLRSKYAAEISRQLSAMKRLQATPKVDHTKLTAIINDLESSAASLHQSNGKFAESLRQNEFLNSVRQHHTSPAGTVSFTAPGLHLWLENNGQERLQHLKLWLSCFDDIYQISALLLNLVRSSATTHIKHASRGFYQGNLDPQSSSQLIRVGVAAHYQVFPQISVGRHGLNIRFLSANLDERATQTTRDVSFELGTCVL